MADKIPALIFVWDGFVMTPALPKAAERHFVIGANYNLVPNSGRSSASDGHWFAALSDAHASLGHNMASQFPTVEHLRKFSLIKVGWVNIKKHACATNAEAERIAAAVQDVNDFAIVTVEGTICTVYTAKSQRHEAQNRGEFQRVKTLALEYIADMIGVPVETLSRNAGQSA